MYSIGSHVAAHRQILYAQIFTPSVQVFISVMELIPTALKYDEHNKYTSKSIVFGMMVMAASLLFFTI